MAGKKQHYVPQFLLRNFGLRGSPGQVAAYRIPEDKFIPRTSVRDQAHENHFYGSPGIEDQLAHLEGNAAQVVGNAIRYEELPDPLSKGYFALVTFAMLQAARTRGAAEETNDMTDRFFKRMMADVPGLGEHLDLIRIVDTAAPANTMLSLLVNLPLTYDLGYKLLCNRTAVPFVISDDPAVLYNQFLEPRKRVGCNTGLAAKGLQVFLPLGPRHLLIFFDRDVYKVGGRRLSSRRVEVTAEADVRGLNLLQAVNAEESLYLGDGVSAAEVRALVQKASKYRPAERTQMHEYQPAGGDIALDGVLIRSYRSDVRTHLKLRCVRLTPQAEKYDPGGRVIHYRDPTTVRLHDRFRAGVDAGKYREDQFRVFLDDLKAGRVSGRPPVGAGDDRRTTGVLFRSEKLGELIVRPNADEGRDAG